MGHRSGSASLPRPCVSCLSSLDLYRQGLGVQDLPCMSADKMEVVFPHYPQNKVF